MADEYRHGNLMPPSRMKTAFIIARYPPLSGGTEAQAKNLAKALAARGFEVTVLTRAYPGLPNREMADGVTVNRLRAPGCGAVASFAFACSLLLHLLKNRAAYDIYHVHLASSHAVLAAFLGPLLKIPTVLKFGATREFGDIGTSKGKFGGQWKLNFLKRRISAFVCTSREMLNEVTAEGFDASRAHLIPNGVDTTVYCPASSAEREALRAKLGLTGRPVALFSGRLEAQKGLETLLDAWRLVVKIKPDALLILAGSGSREGLLLEKAKQEGVSSAVKFTGQLNAEELRDYYRCVDIFVLPSLAEGLSNSLLEAMACGLPIVATRVGGNEDLVHNGINGNLVKPGQAKPFANAVLSMLDDAPAASRMGARARETAESGYSIEHVAQQYVKLYQTCKTQD